MNQLQPQEVPALIYALPRTGIEVTLNLKRSYFVPGPYAAYAEKYLGIDHVPEEADINWNILSAKVSSFEDTDPAAYYSLTGPVSDFDLTGLTSLTQEGFILNPSFRGSEKTNSFSIPETKDGPWFLNSTYKDLMREKTDTLYKTILEDSVLIKIPVFRKVTEMKSIEDRARETAHLIHKLRKRRLKIISNDYSTLPQGEAMVVALKELDRSEKLYTSLFCGLTFEDTICQKWDIVPDETYQNGNEIGRFSAESGILPAGSAEGQALSLLIRSYGTTDGIPDFQPAGTNTLFYRLPEKASLELKSGMRTLLQCNILVYQFGKLVPLAIPAKVKLHKFR